MTFEFRPGVRDKTSTLIALAGPTGCGKTFTAILIAMGIAYPHMSNEEILATVKAEGKSRVFFIDTEGGRGLHYCPGPGMEADFVETFPYQYGEITAPYTPERYTEAAEAAEAAGAWVIILDSASHEYESEGGIMEMADQIEAGTPKPGITNPRDPFSSDGWKDWVTKPVKSPGNWKEPKTRHKRMMNRLIQLRAHVIFCLRAEEKMLMTTETWTDNSGRERKKAVIIPAEQRPLLERWAPICEKRFMYEMTVSFLLLPDRPGTGIPIKKLQGAFRAIFTGQHEGTLLGRDHGEALSDWSVGRKKGGERVLARSGPSLSDPPDETMGYGAQSDDPPPRDDRPADPPAGQDGKPRTAKDFAADYIAQINACQTIIDFNQLVAANEHDVDRLEGVSQALFAQCCEAEAAMREKLGGR